jgi:hypothetical protein
MSNDRELPLEIMEQVSGGFKLPGVTILGAKLPPSGRGSGGRQPIDPSPGLGSGYSGDSAGGSGGGGYFGDPNAPGHQQFQAKRNPPG